MHVSVTEIWFLQSSTQVQRMKFLLWLRRQCLAAGYDCVRLLGRSPVAKPPDASDYVMVVECADDQQYYRLLPTIAKLCSGIRERFIAAGGIKWGEGLFFDVAPPMSASSIAQTHAEAQEVRL